MKFFTFTFLAICLLSFSAFGQGETARKIYEIPETTDGDIKNSIQNIRDDELAKNLKSKLYVVNHGLPLLVERRLKQLNKAFDFLGINRTRVEISQPIPNPFLMTEFWIVPEGAENPKPTIYAEKFGEFGTDLSEGKELLQNLRDSYMSANPLLNAFIVNYGTKKQQVLRMKNMKKAVKFLLLDESRIQIVDGGTSKTLKTEFWIVPPKSEK
jgi:hypothetical protein